MPATMLRTVCCRADGVSKPRSLGAEASRKLPGRIPKARQNTSRVILLGKLWCGLSLCMWCRLVSRLSDIPGQPLWRLREAQC